MSMRSGLGVAAILLFAGCAGQTSTTPPAPPLPAPQAAAVAPSAASTASGPSLSCRSTRSFDEHWTVRMTVSNNGLPCSFHTDFTNTSGRIAGQHVVYTGGSVTAEPQHGTAALRFEPTQSFADYTPRPGYVGPDRFELRPTPGTRGWVIEVNVTAGK